MERMFKKIFSLSLLFSVCAAFAADEPSKAVTPKFTIRSQGTNAARRAMGSVGHVMLYDMEKWYGTLSFTPEYTRAFNRDDIAKCLFGDSLTNCKTIKIQGSAVENREDGALLADYFYLPADFSSDFTVNPLIQNFLVDMNFFLGLDEWVQGLYFFAQAPVTYTKWDLNCCESNIVRGTLAHPEGYFTTDAMERSKLLEDFRSFARGNAPDTFEGTDITTKFNGLACAKMCCGSADTETALSELRFALGYNFLLDEDYHLGLNFQVSAPTGNNVKPDFLFAAQNGNDNHWEVGGALNASFILWRSEDEEKHFGFYFDANLTHMFKNKQKRCFDLCGKPLSRYMLAEKMTTDVANLNETGATTNIPSNQFNNEYAPVANITSLDVDVSVGINADIVAMFNYTSNNWAWDLGYNFWGRSCEKIRLNCDCTGFEETWALKGDSHMYGHDGSNFIALSATNNEATINGGSNYGTAGVTAGSTEDFTARTNPKVDNKKLAANGATQLNIDSTHGDDVYTSIDPVLIKQSAINFARTKGISHKVFSHLSYNWFDREDWIPYIGVGFEAEFASDSSSCDSDCSSCETSCDTDCSDSKTNGDCIKCGLDQWGILVKVGASF